LSTKEDVEPHERAGAVAVMRAISVSPLGQEERVVIIISYSERDDEKVLA
jgi:hypothetical protein